MIAVKGGTATGKMSIGGIGGAERGSSGVASSFSSRSLSSFAPRVENGLKTSKYGSAMSSFGEAARPKVSLIKNTPKPAIEIFNAKPHVDIGLAKMTDHNSITSRIESPKVSLIKNYTNSKTAIPGHHSGMTVDRLSTLVKQPDATPVQLHRITQNLRPVITNATYKESIPQKSTNEFAKKETVKPEVQTYLTPGVGDAPAVRQSFESQETNRSVAEVSKLTERESTRSNEGKTVRANTIQPVGKDPEVQTYLTPGVGDAIAEKEDEKQKRKMKLPKSIIQGVRKAMVAENPMKALQELDQKRQKTSADAKSQLLATVKSSDKKAPTNGASSVETKSAIVGPKGKRNAIERGMRTVLATFTDALRSEEKKKVVRYSPAEKARERQWDDAVTRVLPRWSRRTEVPLSEIVQVLDGPTSLTTSPAAIDAGVPDGSDSGAKSWRGYVASLSGIVSRWQARLIGQDAISQRPAGIHRTDGQELKPKYISLILAEGEEQNEKTAA